MTIPTVDDPHARPETSLPPLREGEQPPAAMPPIAEEKRREVAFQQERKAFRLAGVWAVIALLAWGSGVGLQLLPAADRVKRMVWLEFLGFVVVIASLAVCVALARWLAAIRRRRQLDAGRFRPDDR